MIRGPVGGRRNVVSFGTLRDGKEVRSGQKVRQEDLQPPIEQRRAPDVTLFPARRPEFFVHLDVDDQSPGFRVEFEQPDGLEDRDRIGRSR